MQHFEVYFREYEVHLEKLRGELTTFQRDILKQEFWDCHRYQIHYGEGIVIDAKVLRKNIAWVAHQDDPEFIQLDLELILPNIYSSQKGRAKVYYKKDHFDLKLLRLNTKIRFEGKVWHAHYSNGVWTMEFTDKALLPPTPEEKAKVAAEKRAAEEREKAAWEERHERAKQADLAYVEGQKQRKRDELSSQWAWDAGLITALAALLPGIFVGAVAWSNLPRDYYSNPSTWIPILYGLGFGLGFSLIFGVIAAIIGYQRGQKGDGS